MFEISEDFILRSVFSGYIYIYIYIYDFLTGSGNFFSTKSPWLIHIVSILSFPPLKNHISPRLLERKPVLVKTVWLAFPTKPVHVCLLLLFATYHELNTETESIEGDSKPPKKNHLQCENKKMPFVSQIKRQTDYNLYSSTTPIVIDNGASNFRIG